LALENLRLA